MTGHPLGAIILAMPPRIIVAALLWSAFWGPAPALSQPAKGGSQGAVEITFVATGPGADSLAIGDLRLSADGKNQAITGLQRVAAAGGSDAVKLPPHTYSNRSEGAAAAQNVVVILLDGVNTQWRNDASAREATLRALEQIKPDERVAIFLLGKNLQVLSDFTDDGVARATKLKTFASGEPAGLNYKDLVLPVPQNGNSRAGMYEEQQRMATTFTALSGLSANLKGLSGRKNLLWVSADFPLLLGQADLGGRGIRDSSGNNQSDIDIQRTAAASYNQAADGLIRSFQAAGVAVYPVDARGVSLNPIETNSRITYVTPAADANQAEKNRVAINDIMKHVATETGGAVFSDSKDLGRALRGALDDGEGAYVLTFTPSKASENGSIHKIKLQTKQKGAQIRVGPGYYAPAAATNQQPSQRLAAALSAPLNIAEIGLVIRIETDPADPSAMAISLQIDPHDLDLTQQGDTWAGQIGVGSFQGSLSGEQFGKQMQSVQVSLSKSAYQKAVADGGGIHVDLTMKRAPTASFVRFAVIDLKLPKAGSLLAPLP